MPQLCMMEVIRRCLLWTHSWHVDCNCGMALCGVWLVARCMKCVHAVYARGFREHNTTECPLSPTVRLRLWKHLKTTNTLVFYKCHHGAHSLQHSNIGTRLPEGQLYDTVAAS
jgi:hypothetical protein